MICSTQQEKRLAQYRNMGVQADIASASPHRLIQMLMEGALEKIGLAKGHMLRGETAQKESHIVWAVAIIDGLRMSLDKQAGGEIAENMDALYEYMGRRLTLAKQNNDVEILAEISALIMEIKLAWDAIPALREQNNRHAHA